MLLWPFITQTSPMTMLSISSFSSPEVTISFWPAALAGWAGNVTSHRPFVAAGRGLGLRLAKLDRHLLPGLGPTPDHDRLVALNDHVA